ncbi:MAG TPA: DNA polymerase III subunit gamma/tau [Candidatus Binataceae bacterium]|nr:DNA polymerase III subunit gamma/tau [Candidatus Binataceae bacterium]
MASTPHLVLARKWRPERFSDLVGQEHVTRTLSEALKRGRIAHAFLFTGIRGVGKTTAARILARCLNCERGPTAEPCGECAACLEIRAGSALDVSEIDGATYRKIDDARAIIENLSYRPARDRFKIYIIDEAHQLTDQAFNALLKTLEEPPAHVKFILATTEPQKMPETILSRLQRYDFRRIPMASIHERLRDLAAREKIEAEEAALRLLAREAGGSMRDAERMLETAIASAPEGRVSEAEVAASLGVASRTIVFAIIESVLERKAAPALRAIRELAARGANLESLGRDLLETLRNLAVAKLPQDPGHQDQSPLDELPDHEALELRRLAALTSNRDLMRLFRLMAQTQEELIRSPYPDLLLEMAIVRMASLAPIVDMDELLRAIAAGGASTPGASSPASGSSGAGMRPEAGSPSDAGPPAGSRKLRVEGEVKASAPIRAAAPGAGITPLPGAPAALAREREMPELREHIKSRRAALAGFMEQGAALSLEGDVLSIAPRRDIYQRYLADNRAVIAELAAEFFGREIRAEIVDSQPAASIPAATPSQPPERAATSAAEAAAERVPMTQASAPRAPATDPRDPDGAQPKSIQPGPATRRVSTSPEERAALYADPVVERVFESLEARLVEVRAPIAAAPIAAAEIAAGFEDPADDAEPRD